MNNSLKKKIIIVSLVIALVVGMVFVVTYLFKGKKTMEDTTQEQTYESPYNEKGGAINENTKEKQGVHEPEEQFPFQDVNN